MYGKFKDFLAQELDNIKAAGLYKNERIITTPQRADIKVNAGSDVLNFCANNYLGLSDNKRLIEAAKAPWTLMATVCHPFASSAEPKICTSNLKLPFPIISRQKTPSCMQPASMPTVVCLNRSSPMKMPSFQMP